MSHIVIYEFSHGASGNLLSKCEQFKSALQDLGVSVTFLNDSNIGDGAWRCKIEGDDFDHINWTLVKLESMDEELEKNRKQAELAEKDISAIKVAASEEASRIIQTANGKAEKIKQDANKKVTKINEQANSRIDKNYTQAGEEADRIESKADEKAAKLLKKNLYGTEAKRVKERGHREACKVRRKSSFKTKQIKEEAKREADYVVARANLEAEKIQEMAKEAAYWVKEKAFDEVDRIKDKLAKKQEKIINHVCEDIAQDSKKYNFFSLFKMFESDEKADEN